MSGLGDMSNALKPLTIKDVVHPGKSRSVENLIRSIRSKPESWWVHEGDHRALALFHDMAKHVPAYKHFLKKNSVNPAHIRTINDFVEVPETNKKNYTSKYSLKDRSFNGDMSTHKVLAVSSGTTGTPTLWPRGLSQEAEAAQVHAMLFSDLYEVDKYKTLIIIGFPMGIYVSGVATTLPTFFSSIVHPSISIITAGNNKENILAVVPQVQGLYEQIILVGHPFFIKDVLESGKRNGINWSKTKLKTFFCSEGYNEEWRDYLGTLVKVSRPGNSFFNTYGSSELLLMGYETPESIGVKRYLENHQTIQEAVLGKAGPLSLFQYNPLIRHISVNAGGELLFTSRSGIPLCRYNLKDAGAVLRRRDMLRTASPVVHNWKPWNLPYVVLFGRSDHTLIFFAANIYPEHIHAALNHRQFLKKITGKFVMEKNYTSAMDPKLIVHIELQEGQRGGVSFQQALKRRLVEMLLTLNLEYADASERVDKDLVPKVVLHRYRDEKFFKPGLKPRYIA